MFRERILGGWIVKPKVERDFKFISEKVDLTSGLVTEKAFAEWVPRPYIRDADVRPLVEAEAPVDGVEIVEWMHDCAIANVVLYGVAEAYDRLGSRLLVASGDPYTPGVGISSDYKYKSWKGDTVRRRGYAEAVTPVGTVRVPAEGALTVASGKFLGWLAALKLREEQWKGVLMHWAELASKPVTERVQHANIEGFVAPQFFNIPAPLALPVNRTTVTLTSDKSQTVVLRGRSPADYGTVMFELKQEIPSGQSSILYRVIGLPSATAHVLEIQPENGTATIVDSIE
jgi:hypothetical protein